MNQMVDQSPGSHVSPEAKAKRELKKILNSKALSSVLENFHKDIEECLMGFSIKNNRLSISTSQKKSYDPDAGMDLLATNLLQGELDMDGRLNDKSIFAFSHISLRLEEMEESLFSNPDFLRLAPRFMENTESGLSIILCKKMLTHFSGNRPDGLEAVYGIDEIVELTKLLAKARVSPPLTKYSVGAGLGAALANALISEPMDSSNNKDTSHIPEEQDPDRSADEAKGDSQSCVFYTEESDVDAIQPTGELPLMEETGPSSRAGTEHAPHVNRAGLDETEAPANLTEKLKRIGVGKPMLERILSHDECRGSEDKCLKELTTMLKEQGRRTLITIYRGDGLPPGSIPPDIGDAVLSDTSQATVFLEQGSEEIIGIISERYGVSDEAAKILLYKTPTSRNDRTSLLDSLDKTLDLLAETDDPAEALREMIMQEPEAFGSEDSLNDLLSSRYHISTRNHPSERSEEEHGDILKDDLKNALLEMGASEGLIKRILYNILEIGCDPEENLDNLKRIRAKLGDDATEILLYRTKNNLPINITYARTRSVVKDFRRIGLLDYNTAKSYGVDIEMEEGMCGFEEKANQIVKRYKVSKAAAWILILKRTNKQNFDEKLSRNLEYAMKKLKDKRENPVEDFREMIITTPSMFNDLSKINKKLQEYPSQEGEIENPEPVAKAPETKRIDEGDSEEAGLDSDCLEQKGPDQANAFSTILKTGDAVEDKIHPKSEELQPDERKAAVEGQEEATGGDVREIMGRIGKISTANAARIEECSNPEKAVRRAEFVRDSIEREDYSESNKNRLMKKLFASSGFMDSLLEDNDDDFLDTLCHEMDMFSRSKSMKNPNDNSILKKPDAIPVQILEMEIPEYLETFISSRELDPREFFYIVIKSFRGFGNRLDDPIKEDLIRNVSGLVKTQVDRERVFNVLKVITYEETVKYKVRVKIKSEEDIPGKGPERGVLQMLKKIHKAINNNGR